MRRRAATRTRPSRRSTALRRRGRGGDRRLASCGRSSTTPTSGASGSCSSERAPGVFVTLLAARSRRCSASTSAPSTTARQRVRRPEGRGLPRRPRVRCCATRGCATRCWSCRPAAASRPSVDAARQRPIVTLDSGPTGGILGCQYLGRLYGEAERHLHRRRRHVLRRRPDPARRGPARARAGGLPVRHAHPEGLGPVDRRGRRLDRLARRRAACCASARRARAPGPGPPATAGAGPSRRSPTPTSCSATSTPTRSSAGG